MKSRPIVILCDTREQAPPPFPDGAELARGTMGEGDYSTPRLVNVARIERKGRVDFASSITWGRDRLDREMVRLQSYPWRAIVVEANLTDYQIHRDGSGVHPHAVLGTVASYLARYQVPILFAGNAANCGRLIHGLLFRWEELQQHQA